MKQFEYKIVSQLQTFNLQESLVKLGLEGWEATSMCYTPKGDLVILFKRETNE
jgi:hypothetical protein